VGKRHLESAIESIRDQAEFKVSWKPFFLNPNTPDEGIPLIDYISSRYGPEAGQKIREGKSALYDFGKSLGIFFNKDRLIVNSLRSHCLLEYAKSVNCQNAASEELFHVYFEEGRNINNNAVLMEICKKANIDENEAMKSIESKEVQAAINKEAVNAHTRGINGVPFFDIYIEGINEKKPVSFSGAQGKEVFLDVFGKLLHAFKLKT